MKRFLPLIFIIISFCGSSHFAISLKAQGNTCANAIAISSTPYSSGTLTSCGKGNNYSNGENLCGNQSTANSDGEEAILTFTPSSTNCYSITFNALGGTGLVYSAFYILDDCPNAAGVNCINSGSMNSSTGTLRFQENFVAGTTYYLVVEADDFGGACYDYSVDISECPNGETCDDAIEIINLPYTNTNSTCSYANNAENVCGVNSYDEGPDVFYEYTSDKDTCININIYNITDNPNYLSVAIFNGSCASKGCIASYDSYGFDNFTPFSYSISAGETIYIMVDADGGDCSGFTIDVTENCLPGENCGNPITFSDLPFNDNRNNCSYNNDFQDYPDCANANGSDSDEGDVLYKYIPKIDGCIDINVTAPNNIYWNFQVYSGNCSPNSGNCITGVSDWNGNQTMSVDVQNGVPIYFIFDTYINDCGNYSVSVTESQGTSCASAEVLNPASINTTSTYTINSDNCQSCTSSFRPDTLCGGGQAMNGKDYIYKLTPDRNICIDLNATQLNGALTNANSDMGIYILDACPDIANPTNCVAFSNSTNATQSLNDITLYQGKDYYIIVDSEIQNGENCVEYRLEIEECTPPILGDNCNNPYVIPSVPYNSGNRNTNSHENSFSNAQGDNMCGIFFNDDGHDVVYSYTAPRNQCLNISVDGWDVAMQGAFAVMTSCPDDPNSNCIYSSEGGTLLGTFLGGGPQEGTDIQVFKDQTIYIVVDYGRDRSLLGLFGDDDLMTDYVLNIDTCATIPPCESDQMAADNCADATFICDLSYYCGTTETYTPDVPGNLGSQFCGSIENNSWLKFEAGETTAVFEIFTNNCNNNSGIQFLVVETDDCLNFNEIACYSSRGTAGNTQIVVNNLVIGETYHIMIDGYAGDLCDYTFRALSGIATPVAAGEDDNTCGGNSVILNGYVSPPGVALFEWATFGDGTFDDVNKLDAEYTGSPTEIANGFVDLTLTNFGSPNCPGLAVDTVRITFNESELDLVGDTGICLGETAMLVAISDNNVPDTEARSFQNNNAVNIPDNEVGNGWDGVSGLPSQDYAYSSLDVDCINPNGFTLESICLTIRHDDISELDVYLFAPNGHKIHLVNNPAGNGSNNNFASTCFSPTATDNINTSTPPFTGTFVPAGGIASFNGIGDPNGAWTLHVGDSEFSSFFRPGGVLAGWSINFTNQNYVWSPNLNLSSIYGDTVYVSPGATQKYYCEVFDCSTGCVVSDSIEVDVSPMQVTYIDSNITCNGANDGKIIISAEDNFGSVTYLFDGTLNQEKDSIFSKLAPGNYPITLTDSIGCSFDTTLTLTQPAVLQLSLAATDTCTINGAGEITATATGGTLPYTYSIDTGKTFQNSNIFTNLNLGEHYIIVRDSNDCETNATITIYKEPVANVVAGSILCDSLVVDLQTSADEGNDGFIINGPAGSSTNVTGGTNPGDLYRVSVSEFGIYNIDYFIENNVCADTTSFSIEFIEQPEAYFNFQNIACGSKTVRIVEGAAPGNRTRTSSLIDGTTDASNFSGTATPNELIFAAQEYDDYIITLSIDNKGCTDTFQDTVSFIESPFVNISPVADVCDTIISLSATIAQNSNITWKSIPNTDVLFSDIDSTHSDFSITHYGSYQIIAIDSGAANCPPATDTIVVEFFEAPKGYAGNDTTVCDIIGHNLFGEVTVGNGVWTGGSGISDVNDLNSPINLNGTGTHSYTLTISNGVCPDSVSIVNITVDSLPIVNFSPDSVATCGLDYTLNANSAVGSLNWRSKTPSTIATPNSASTEVTNAIYGSNTFYYTDSNGVCPIVTDSIIVFFEERPTPQLLTDSEVCGLTDTLSTTYTIIPENGTWNGNGNFTPKKDTNITIVTVANYGSENYTWTEKSFSVCQDSTVSKNVDFHEQPFANAGNNQEVCGEYALLNASLSVTGSTGQWSYVGLDTANGTLNFSDINDPLSDVTLDNSVGISAYGTYRLYWTESIGSACAPSTDSIDILFVKHVAPYAGPDFEVCGDTTAITAEKVYSKGQWEFVPPTGGSLVFSSRDSVHTGISLGTPKVYGTYKVVWYESLSPCYDTNSDTLEITFFENPTINAGASPDQACGLTGVLRADTTVGNMKWTWQAIAPTTGSISFKNNNDTLPTAEITATQYGSYELVWTITNGVCTPPSDTVIYTFYERPTPTATGPADVCATTPNQSFNLSGTTSSGTQWDWSGPGGVTFTPNAQAKDVQADVTAYGNYRFYFNETNHPVCGVSTDSIDVEVLEEPEISAGADDNTCGPNYQLNGSISKGKGKVNWTVVNVSNIAYSVNFADDSSLTTLTTLTPAPNVIDGAITVVFEVQVESGSCPVKTDQVTVVYEPTPSNVDAGDDSTLCSLLDYDLDATPLNIGETGQWTLSSGAGIATFTDDSDPKSSVSVDTYGTYTFKWTISNSSCSAITDIVTIDFREQPVPYAGLDDSICGTNIAISADAIPTRANGFWTFIPNATSTNNIDFANASSRNTTATSNGAEIYGQSQLIWNVYNGIQGQCADTLTDTVLVSFYEAVNPDAGANIDICGDQEQLFADTSISQFFTDDYTLSWESIDDGNGTATFNPNNLVANPTVTAPSFNTFRFVLHESNGVCPAKTDTVSINFVTTSIPNAGNDIDTCALSAKLQAVPSYGSGSWDLVETVPHSFSPTITDPNAVLTVQNYGTYQAVWIEANNPCPIKQDTVLITFSEQPEPFRIPNTDICGPNKMVNTTASVSSPNYSSLWSCTDPNISIQDPTDLTTLVSLDTAASPYGEFLITFTETNGSCPPADTSFYMNFLEIPEAAPGIDKTVCGDTVRLDAQPSAGSGRWEIQSSPNGAGGSFADFTDPKTLFTANAFGDYILLKWEETTVGKYGGVCSDSETIKLTFFEKPVANAGADKAICGNLTNLIASNSVAGSVLEWSYPGTLPNVTVAPNANPAATNVDNNYDTLTFVLTETNNICVSTDTVDIEFVEQPLALTIANYDTCGLVANLEALPSVGNGIWKHVTGSGNITSPNALSSRVSVNSYGTHKFVWEVQNKIPCTISRDTLEIEFLQTPVINPMDTIDVCGPIANITATNNVGNGTWTNLDGDNITFGSVNSNSTTAEIDQIIGDYSKYHYYQLEWRVVNQGSYGEQCINKDTLTVNYVAQPTANAGTDDEICGLDYELTGTPSIGSGRWEYIGDPLKLGSIDSPNSYQTDVSVVEYGTHSFQLIESNGSICKEDTSVVNITFHKVPESNAGIADSTCGNTLTLTAVKDPAIGANTVGNWTQKSGPGTAVISSPTNHTSVVTVPTEGAYEFYWQETNAICPGSIDSVEFVFETLPTSEAGPIDSACGLNITLNATSTIYNGEWSVVNGPDLTGLNFSDINDPNSDFSASVYGTYSLVWSVTNNVLCPTISDTVSITFIEQPIANAGLDQELCNDSINLLAIPSVGIGEWSISSGPGNVFLNRNDTASIVTRITNNNHYGEYTLTWTETNTNVCPPSSDDVKAYFVQQPNPSLGSDYPICDTLFELKANKSVVVNSDLQWSYTGAQNITIKNVANGIDSVNTNNIYSSYEFVLTETNRACVSTDTVIITNYEQPIAEVIQDYDTCGLEATLISTPTSGTGLWTVVSGGTATILENKDNTTSVTADNYGLYEFAWTVNNNSPCKTDQALLKIDFVETPVAIVTDTILNCGPTAQLNATTSIGDGRWTNLDNDPLIFGNEFSANTNVTLANTDYSDYHWYTVKWTETNLGDFGGICADSTLTDILFVAQPVADAGVNDTICGLEYTLSARPSIGDIRWEYLGADSNFVAWEDSTASITNAEVNTYGNHRFRVFEQNTNICPTDSDDVVIRFVEQPIAHAGLTDTICGFNMTIEAIPSVGQGTWSFVSGPGNLTFDDVNNDSTSITVDTQGEYLIQWIEQNEICTSAPDIINKLFEETPTSNAGPDAAFCGLTAFLNADVPKFDGEWSVANGPGTLQLFSDIQSPKSTFTSDVFGTYTLVWTVTNNFYNGICEPVTDTVIIKLIEQPTAVVGDDLEACTDSITLNATPSVGAGYWKQFDGPGTVSFADSSVANTIAYADSSFGVYTLVWVEDNGPTCFVSTDTLKVNFIEQPQITAGLDREVCGARQFLTGKSSVGDLQWTRIEGRGNANIFEPDSAITEFEVDTFGLHTFELVSTNQICVSKDTVVLDIYEPPVANAGFDVETCGLELEVNSTFSTERGNGYWRVLEFPDSISFQNSGNDTTLVTSTMYGTFNLEWTENNSSFCNASKDTIKITFVEQPIVQLPEDFTICGDSAFVIAQRNVGQGTWSSDKTFISFLPNENSDSVVIKTDNFGYFDIYFEAENTTPCVIARDTINIGFIEQPKASLTVEDTICYGADLTFTLNLEGTPSFDVSVAYGNDTIFLEDAVDGEQASFTNVTQNGTLEILEVRDGSPSSCPLFNPDSENITVLQTPTVNFIGDPVACFGDSVSYDIIFDGIAPFHLELSDGRIIDTNLNNITIHDLYLSTQVITAVNYNSKYCAGIALDSAEITINSLPDATLAVLGDRQICDYDKLTVEIVISNGLPDYNISVAPNYSDTFRYSTSQYTNVFNLPVVPQDSLLIYYEVSDANGCSNEYDILEEFKVQERPQVVADLDDRICDGDSVSMNFLFTGQDLFDLYLIDVEENDSVLFTNLNYSDSRMLYPDKDKTYKIGRIGDGSPNTCYNYIDTTLFIRVKPIPSILTILDTNAMCFGDSVLWEINIDGSAPFKVYYDITEIPDSMDNVKNKSYVWISPDRTGNIEITNVVENGLSCPAFHVPDDFNVYPNPQIDFIATDTASCPPLSLQFIPIVELGQEGGTYIWRHGNQVISETESPEFDFSQEGTYDISLEYVAPTGCGSNLAKLNYLEVYPKPYPAFSYTPEKPSVQQNIIDVYNETPGNNTYFWRMEQVGTSTEVNPSFELPNDDDYLLELCQIATTVANGCIDSICDFIHIKGEELVYIPNVFTPNGDGKNDFLFISAQGVEDFHFMIFNRWGDLIFETKDPETYWDGKFKEEICIDGVYPYIVKYKDRYSVDVKEIRGHVNILK